MTIHSSAVVSPQAELGQGVEIGPFCLVEPNVTIGDGCRLTSHVVVKEGTTLGTENQIFDGAVIGGLPQHATMPEHPGTLVMGNRNVVREYCTIHRSLSEGEQTRVGDDNLVMIGAHIGHDCTVGNHVIMANQVLLAGHTSVEDRAYLSGAVGVHQYCRIGQLAMVGGHARVLKDVPPYVTVDGGTALIVGLNLVGLRRAGLLPQEIKQLKAAYRLIYRQGLTWSEVQEGLAMEFPDGPAAELQRFFSGGGRRGFVQERRSPPGATIRLHRDDDLDPPYQTKVG